MVAESAFWAAVPIMEEQHSMAPLEVGGQDQKENSLKDS
jgi:hypothetical protein